MKNFKKIVLTIMLGVLVLLPSAVYAKTEVKTNEELKVATKNGGDIVLQNDIVLTDDITVKGQNISIDLNGNTITLKAYIDVFEGSLEFKGNGLIKDDREDTNATIYVYGSTDSKAVAFATLTVGKDVKIETKRYGITVWPCEVEENSVKKAVPTYGTVVNFNGTIISTNKNAGAITINGNIKNNGKLENAPIINIGKTAVIKSSADTAMYAAGIGSWNIDGGEFEGNSVIGIKSGKLVINDGVFTAVGVPKAGELYGNGIISTGSAIQIENNAGYAGNMEIVINGGIFNAKFKLLDNDNVTIEYGKFANEIVGYLKNGYIQSKTDGVYSVSNIIGSGAGLLINGKVNADYVKPGEEVTISTMGSFELDSVEVTTSDNQKITVKDNKFVMPNKLVRVNAKTTQFMIFYLNKMKMLK